MKIERIKIKYFRSIYSIDMKNLGAVNILSGRNDCGKSNIIKALNLFFNNKTEWQTPLNFPSDFSYERLKEVRSKAKRRQFIQIVAYFSRGEGYRKTLPDKFWVRRTWFRNSNSPIEANSLRENNIPINSLSRAQASLQKFLNKIRFEYIPAIKERDYFLYCLGNLQDSILRAGGSDSVQELIENLNKAVIEECGSLKKEFKKVANIGIDIELPEDISNLFRAFTVMTEKETSGVPLKQRGDGIQARFLPSLLHHITVGSNKKHIWGFEEPENCLEHSLATKLAEDFINIYSKKTQILLTSHSPAFITLQKKRVSSYRVYLKGSKSEVVGVGDVEARGELYADIGLLRLQEEHQKEFKGEVERLSKIEDLCIELKKATSPILLVEGSTDVTILKMAWIKLYSTREIYFRIIPADVAGENESGSKAGCGMLATQLKGCRKDIPKTVGLFDYDKQGNEAFNLDNNFVSHPELSNVKVHSNNHVAAITFHPSMREGDYYKYKNLPIEFLFPEECITKRIDGKGLVLDNRKVKKTAEEIVIEEVIEFDNPYLRKIKKGTKKYFSEKVVPTFSPSDFESFRKLFEDIEQVFEELT